MTQWTPASVADLVARGALAVNDGYRVRNIELGERGIPFIRGGDIGANGEINIAVTDHIIPAYHAGLTSKIARPNDVAFISKGTVGRVGRLRQDQDNVVFAPQVCYWRTLDSEVLDPGFLYYFMTAPSFQAQLDAVRTHGSMVADYVSLTDQRQFTLPLPPIGMQCAIAGVLGALDDKIEQNRRTSAAIERLARSMFRAWFVDFEPVKAKAAGTASYQSMPQAAFDALPTNLTDSPIGLIPEGWEVQPMSEVTFLTMGQSPSSRFYNEEGLGLPFHQGVTDYGFRFPTHRVYCTADGRLAEENDVLLSVRAPVGRINVADRQLMLGRGLAGLRHKSRSQSFLLQQLRTVFHEEDAVGDGTIYKAVTKKFLANMPLLVPAQEVRDAFEETLKPMDHLVALLEVESRRLANLRDYLLPKLLSGQVRVRDAETTAEGVA